MFKNAFKRKPFHILHKEAESDTGLRKVLGAWSLVSLGIGCIIGAGIFVITGYAAYYKAGPALQISFIVAGLACTFAALCYAEFASMTPVAGSAYTYAYATLGELFGWIIGWDLILEYTVASASVAHGWSKYFQNFIGMFNVSLPALLSRAPFDFNPQLNKITITGSWLDLPALLIVAILTIILVIGIKESARFNNIMVFIKVAVVLLVIAIGAFYIKPENWVPYAPFGWTGISLFGHTILGQTGADGAPIGMLAGAAMIFFAYIGFDSVATQAEEARNPRRDVPIGIIGSLMICTVLYIAVTVVLTGMVPCNQIDINAPVAAAFEKVGLKWAQFIISLGAIIGITSVMLVLMLSQPRVLMAMARDGLLPEKFFAAIHSRFKTPWKSTIITGISVGLLAAFIPLGILAELVNIGTLLAFVMVCVAVLVMRYRHPEIKRHFECPLFPWLPILGAAFCLLLMFSLPAVNWLRLGLWMAVGLIIYLSYGRKHSIVAKLNSQQENQVKAPHS
jgi:APA family basic amino acid/polyamine antiporter